MLHLSRTLILCLSLSLLGSLSAWPSAGHGSHPKEQLKKVRSPPPQSTTTTMNSTTTTPVETLASISKIGTVLPQRGGKLPTDAQFGERQQTGRHRPSFQPDANYDLDFWPHSNVNHTEKPPKTTHPANRTTTTTQPITVEDTYLTVLQGPTDDQTTTPTTAVWPTSLAPTLMTSPSETTGVAVPTEPPVVTSSPSGAATGPTPTVTAEWPMPARSTAQNAQQATATEDRPDQSPVGRHGGSVGTRPMTGSTAGWAEAGTIEYHSTQTTSTATASPRGSVFYSVDVGTEQGAGPTVEKSDVEQVTLVAKPTQTRSADLPTVSEDWLSDLTQQSELPDCNAQRTGICNSTDFWAPRSSTEPSNDTTAAPPNNQSQSPVLIPAPPMFVALYTDWNSAMAAWGLAWDAHVYGLGAVFALVALASALNLLCLPLRCPSGCGYFALVSIFLLAAGCTRAFALLYDAYGHQDRLDSAAASLMLYEAPFPCLTAAFGLVFLLLSMRSRMQLSYSAFQRPCFLACLLLLHFTAAFGPAALLHVDQRGAPLCLLLSLVSRGAFVALASFLAAAYFVFFCYVRADSKHIYHLNNTSPTPAERYNRCPFAESKEWERAAAAVFLSALFSLACAGLQLYAMLHAMGLVGGAEAFRPWPWWAFQLSCRVCEAVVCLALALVVAQPVYCSDRLPQPGSCWTELLAAKSPILPGTYQWSLNQQEKLAICDAIGHGETEWLPLYKLVDERLGGSLNGLDLLYHSNRALAYRDLDPDLPRTLPDTAAPSRGSSCTSDSTADLRPPSPINLRRSIDEALFSEALFPMSLFSPARPFRCSERSLDARDPPFGSGGHTLRETQPSDPGLYRTSSCMEVLPLAPLSTYAQQDAPELGFPPSPSPSPSSSSCSSPERWRGSCSSCSLYRPSLAGSALGLCPSPEGQPPHRHHAPCSANGASSLQRPYRTLHSNSQDSLDPSSELDQSVQEEFISVCRQIDALSVCSETIDL